jgi:uncharacterized membrane protein
MTLPRAHADASGAPGVRGAGAVVVHSGQPGAGAAGVTSASGAYDTTLPGRALRTLAGVFVVTWSFRLSGYVTFAPWLAVPVVVLGLTGLLVIVAAWLPESSKGSARQHQIGWVALVAALAALALWSYFQIVITSDYGTDEVAFDQYAAQLAVGGINPYLHSMAPAFSLFHVSPNGYTFQLNGAPVTSLSYPALSFEAYLPLLALGLTTQAANWTNVAAWALGAVILYAVLPRRLAPLATVLASTDIFISYAIGGVTDALFVPLLVGAAVGWDRFSLTRGPVAWRGPILLGLAMAVKQTPWLVAPFLVAGIALESRRAQGSDRAIRDGLRYAGIAAAAFLAPNLPYLIGAPRAWLRGVLTPLSAHAVPAGQGLIGLSLSLHVGGGSLLAYNVAAVAVLAAAFACYVATYPALKPAAFLIPSIVLFFAARSFGSYLVMLIPAVIAAAATTRRPPLTACWRHWKWVALTGACVSAAAIAVAVTASSPLGISIRSVRTTGQLATVEQLTLSVVNKTGHSVRPAFTIEDGTRMTAFWRRQQGPAVLGAHRRASYTIAAPSYFAMPSIGTGFQVLAFLQGPASVSRTGAYLASAWRVVLEPATVDQPVPVGKEITVRAEIVNRLGRRIPAANVPVYLGQVIYAQRGLQFGQATINQGLPGQTPVQALTDAAGVATFTVRSPLAGTDPIYFEANLVNPASFYPYGYSPILAVRFVS